MVASQNGFCSRKLSIHKQTNITQIMTNNITFFINLILYHREIVKLDHFITLSLSYANTDPWCSHCKIHRFVAAPKQWRKGCKTDSKFAWATWAHAQQGQPLNGSMEQQYRGRIIARIEDGTVSGSMKGTRDVASSQQDGNRGCIMYGVSNMLAS
jgi:hypothetical protein